jgi:hypothetical protein
MNTLHNRTAQHGRFQPSLTAIAFDSHARLYAVMDSVFASLVGVLGAILGAVVAAFTANRSDRRRDAVQDRRELRELRTEHGRWRRDRRQAAYTAFMSAASSADRANQELFRSLDPKVLGSVLDEARLGEVRRLFKDAEEAHYLVLLEGSAGLADAVLAVLNALSELVAGTREFVEDHAGAVPGSDLRAYEVRVLGRAFMATYRRFVDEAREASDGDAFGQPG